ncbi:MAG: GTPase [Bdellovibrio bacteriovorus]
MSEPVSTPRLIRIVLALGLGLLVLLLLWGLLILTETGLEVWERLDRGPDWFFWLYAIGFSGITGVGGYLLWRLLRPRRKGAKAAWQNPRTLTRASVEERIRSAEQQGVDLAEVRRELALLQRRKEAGKIQVSFFGEISCGKSSLIKALLPGAELAINVRGGTTREVRDYHWQSPGGDELILTDMPGTNEVGAGLDALARDEALRSHLVVYVCEGDLTRSQHDDLQVLIELGKPCIVVLNKTDRYRQEELAQLIERVAQRLGDRARVELVAVQAGGEREVLLVHPDGREETVVRAMAPRVGQLAEALQRHLDTDPQVLEELRDASVFVLLDRRLDEAQARFRRERAAVITTSYSRKAMIGAMAAITPGSDLIIQGYLGVAMVKEISALYGVSVRQMDTEVFLQLIQKKVARTTAIMLAVAGNALKSFPGIGTLAGGIAHAAAYGMIFDALGRALAQSLESRGDLRPAQAAQVFEERLSEDLEASARRFARLALELRREGRPREQAPAD